MLITRKSMATDVERTLDLNVTQEQIDAWQAGMLIQKAMPQLAAAEREFIKTHITDEEWKEMFADDGE